ncbi:fungal-specific transcription factor domain-containing protein [Aspergillus californicus]
MEGIIQLLIFEIVVNRTPDWEIHPTPAITLFEQIVQHCEMPASGHCAFDALLTQVSLRSSDEAGSARLPSNVDQPAFWFFSAFLLVADIISSTSLETPPALHRYHEHLLVGQNSLGQSPFLRLETYMGCHNWVFLVVADIAALDVWKKNMTRMGKLSRADLTARSDRIAADLHTGIAHLNTSEESSPTRFKHGLHDLLTAHPCNPCAPDQPPVLTRIWGYAAQTYLDVTVSGWQPSSPHIHQTVTATIDLLRDLASPFSLRAVIWPFCVTGCLAAPEQEQELREMVFAMGTLQTFGPEREALSIMESVWKKRKCLQVEQTFDIAACLRILGRPAILV